MNPKALENTGMTTKDEDQLHMTTAEVLWYLTYDSKRQHQQKDSYSHQDCINDFRAPGLTGVMGPFHIQRNKVLREDICRL